MKIQKTICLFGAVMLGSWSCFQAAAQTPPATPPEPRKTTVSTRVNPVIVENELAAPQVVTVLHRLNGLKVFRLLVRSKELVGAVAKLDQAFQIEGEVHTNVIAGLALDDGQTIAAWLPEAEAEMPPAIPFAPRAPAPPRTGAPTKERAVPVEAPMSIPRMPSIAINGNLLEPADLKVIMRDGKRLSGRYVGLDGLTGLSVIALAGSNASQPVDSKEETVNVGQRLRVIGPQPDPDSEANPGTPMYVRVGITEATVVNVSRSPSGALARVKIKSPKLSAANIGGIALSDAGQTLGIVDAVEGSEATMVPVALVRMAAKRVIARQASVPRPWLGVRGEPIGSLSPERIQRVGWELERARALTEKRQGILLTFVAPGSPAELAQLKPGDVILSVNNGDVRNADDFSWLLDEAGPGNAVHFTVARPGQESAETFDIRLFESPDPLFGLRMFKDKMPAAFKPGSLISQGIETIAIKPKVASRFGATGGLLVVSVQPASPAFKAGLRPGDMIESINGEHVLSGSAPMELLKNASTGSTFMVVRNRQKLVLTIPTTNKTSPAP